MDTSQNNIGKVSISKQELSTLQPESVNSDILLINSEQEIEEAVKVLRSSDVIGFDTETKPSFKKGQTNNVALLQLATRDICYLFRINQIGLPESVRKLLEDPQVLKIGLSIHDDFHNLHKNHELNPEGFIDLQSFVKDYKIADNSLSRIYAVIFGKRISKSQRLSNWEAHELTPAQQTYAALDAFACIRIYDYLKAGKFSPENSIYFQTTDNISSNSDNNRPSE